MNAKAFFTATALSLTLAPHAGAKPAYHLDGMPEIRRACFVEQFEEQFGYVLRYDRKTSRREKMPVYSARRHYEDGKLDIDISAMFKPNGNITTYLKLQSPTHTYRFALPVLPQKKRVLLIASSNENAITGRRPLGIMMNMLRSPIATIINNCYERPTLSL